MKYERVTCLIDRHSSLKIEKTVPAWEVRVLGAIFGEPNISVVRTEQVEADFDPKEEFESMVRRYGTAQDADSKKIIFQVYPDAYALERAVDRMTEAPRKKAEHRAAA